MQNPVRFCTMIQRITRHAGRQRRDQDGVGLDTLIAASMMMVRSDMALLLGSVTPALGLADFNS